MNSKSTEKVFQAVNTYGLNNPYVNFSALDKYYHSEKIWFNVLTSIWKSYFTFGYYILVIPFKPVYDRGTNRLLLKTCKLQQVFCLLFWGLAGFYLITDVLGQLISGLQSQQKLTAKSYFVVINNIIMIITFNLFVVKLRKHSKLIEVQLNVIKSLPLIVSRGTARCCYLYVIFSAGILVCCTILPLPFSTMSGIYFGSLQKSFEFHVDCMRERLFMSKTLDHFSTENVFLGSLLYILRFSWGISYAFLNEICSCMLSVTFWLITKCFEGDIRALTEASSYVMLQTKHSYLVNIKNRYEEIKKASDSVNQVWSTMALMWLIDTAIRMMMMMNMLVSSRQPYSVVMMLFWALLFIAFMIISGETFRMMDCFEGVLLEDTNWNRFYDQDKKLLIRLLNELKGKPIGIGATGLYKLDYGFIAQLLVAILTIFLVSFD